MASIIELHTLRTLGVSSLNRGENGEVKTCIIGDVLRSRISSQALKAAIRKEFGDTFRTRVLIHEYLMPKCRKECPEQMDEMEKYFNILMNVKKDGVETDQILAYSLGEADAIFNFVKNLSEEEKTVLIGKDKKKIDSLQEKYVNYVKEADLSVDIAIFGRMSTDGPTYTIPSAVHVNHAYSIDEHHCEEDFFTAFDNLKEESAHLNALQYTSTTVYDYMNIDPVQVYRNLMLPIKRKELAAEEYEAVSMKKKSLAIDGVVKVAELMMQVMPSGKQNSMATYPLPSMIYATIDNHTYPCTLDPCFNRIIRCRSDKSIVASGTERVMKYVTETADKCNYRAFFIDSNLQEELSEDVLRNVEEDGIICTGVRKRNALLDEIRKQAEMMINEFC